MHYFSSLGLDTSASVAVRILNAFIENNGIPFSVQYKIIPSSLEEAVYDSRFRQNLNASFDSAEDAVVSMLKD